MTVKISLFTYNGTLLSFSFQSTIPHVKLRLPEYVPAFSGFSLGTTVRTIKLALELLFRLVGVNKPMRSPGATTVSPFLIVIDTVSVLFVNSSVFVADRSQYRLLFVGKSDQDSMLILKVVGEPSLFKLNPVGTDIVYCVL